MRSFILPALALFTLSTIAAPAPSTGTNSQSTCMTEADAKKVANNFKDLINLDFNKTLAREALCEDFHDYSDGVNELINAGCKGPNTLGEATFSSRTEFINGQSTQPPIPFDILNLWHTCSTVIMRWRSSAPGHVKPEQLVTGIVVIETTPNPDASSTQPFLMETVYSEFNSGAWLYDLGNFTASCTAAGLPKKANVAGKMSVSSSAPASTGTGT
jgi:hypothetical protein